jgi:3D (Asp-Asp-Asp) domain-containing protein
MSYELRAIGTKSRCALAFVLALASASTAFSQSVCHPIRRGESATQLARRITGDSRNTYQPWFQIMDASSRFIPKSQYSRIRPGWRACIVEEAVESRVQIAPAIQRPTLAATDLPRNPPRATSAPPSVTALGVPLDWLAKAVRPIAGVDLTWLWLGSAVIVPLFGWRIVDDYVGRRNTRLIVMKHFAHRFVREFERPLIQQQEDRPVRSRLRLSPARARLDILLAPGQGRRYPNLTDHKKNVEYDVVRIVQSLADDSFVRDPIYVQAGWVVVPFRFKVGHKHSGVPCRSSF